MTERRCTVKAIRNYSSPLRAAQAEQTRRRIVDSARDLFVQQGYPATSIAAVARHAKVSADTVYSVFGTKIAVLKAVLDVAAVGDDADQPVLDRAGPQAMRAEPDQRRQIAMFAAGVTEQLERVRQLDDVLRSAAAVDAAAAELRADIQLRQRRAAMSTAVSWLAAHGPLRTRKEDASAVVWTLTSPEVHRMLREDCSWTAARYRRWLTETLTDSLLPPG